MMNVIISSGLNIHTYCIVRKTDNMNVDKHTLYIFHFSCIVCSVLASETDTICP